MNPRAVKIKVAKGTVSGLPASHKFHCKTISDGWVKVDLVDIIHPATALMLEPPGEEQKVLGDAKGSCALWSAKYVKRTP